MDGGQVDIEAYIKSLEEAYQPRAIAAAAHELYLFASAVIAQAKELCPRKSGTLAESDVIEEPEINGFSVTINFGFNTDYAAAVHEILTNKHPQGQAKYLSTPLNAMAPLLPARLMAAIQEAVG